MRESRTSGSVGDPGGQPLRSTRHPVWGSACRRYCRRLMAFVEHVALNGGQEPRNSYSEARLFRRANGSFLRFVRVVTRGTDLR